MNDEELRQFARRQPFRPFRITLTTGETHDIRHPDLIMVGRRSCAIGVTSDPTSIAGDYIMTIDLFHVVSIRELPAATVASN